jgi:hypothetical protein
MLHARQYDLGSRIVQQMILPRHPLEEAFDGLQPRVLRAEAKRKELTPNSGGFLAAED